MDKEFFFKQLNDFINYSPSSRIGKFFKAIASNDLTAIRDSFNRLDDSLKCKIEEVLCQKAEIQAKYVDLFTDMGLLVRSAHEAIRGLYESLDEKHQELVRLHVCNLAGQINNSNHKCCSAHLFDHLLRFSDALETVISPFIAPNQ